ncbi:MAG: hypothetical protein WC931_05225 [Bacilli bacterium]
MTASTALFLDRSCTGFIRLSKSSADETCRRLNGNPRDGDGTDSNVYQVRRHYIAWGRNADKRPASQSNRAKHTGRRQHDFNRFF